MAHFYIAPWVFTPNHPVFGEDAWHPPGKPTGIKDLLRPTAFPAGGAGLFVYDSPQALPGAVTLGSDLRADLRQAQKDGLALALGLTQSILSTRLDQVLSELHLDPRHYDATGVNRWKPLRGSRRKGVIRLELGGQTAINEPFDEQYAVAVFQADYRRDKALVDSGKMSVEHLEKYTGSVMLNLFGRMSDSLASDILPSEHDTDGWRAPTTTLTYPFNAADTTHIEDDDANWGATSGGPIEVTSNRGNTDGTGFDEYRYNSDLSGDAHHCQVEIHTLTADDTNNTARPLTRFLSSARTHYGAAFAGDGGSGHEVYLFRRDAGTFNNIAAATAFTYSAGAVAKLESPDDDVHDGIYNGTSILTATDSTYTGASYVRGGLALQSGALEDDSVVDNWEAADIAAGGADVRSHIIPAYMRVNA